MSVSLIVFLIVFLVLLLLGTPVAWTMVISSTIWIAVTNQWYLLPVFPERIFQNMNSFTLLAIPLFILAGEIINEGKITERLIHFANLTFGWIRGGLAQVNIGASILFSGITGVALGDIAALGKVFIPSMVKQGYSAAYAAAVTASSSIIGPMVPPSLIIVIYGSVTGVSIGALLVACIIPGIVIGITQMILVYIQARIYGFQPVKADRSPKALIQATGQASLPLMVPIIIILGIVGGIMTPTEAGAASAFYALILCMLVYKSINMKGLYHVFRRSMIFSGQLIIIVGCGGVFAWVMGIENVPVMLTRFLRAQEFTPFMTLMMFNLFLLFIGMFIDPSAAIILFAPILSQAASAVGINPLHFGVVMILNLNIGLLTPPLGVCLFAAERIAQCGLGNLIRKNMPFLAVSIVALLLITYLPVISMWLPRILGFV